MYAGHVEAPVDIALRGGDGVEAHLESGRPQEPAVEHPFYKVSDILKRNGLPTSCVLPMVCHRASEISQDAGVKLH